jgi:hypothetical protein
MARRASVTRWVTKLVRRNGKQFRQRYRVAEKVAKKLGKRVAKVAKRELRDFKKARERSAKKAAAGKERQQARAAKKAGKPAPAATRPQSKWREVIVEGKRSWIRLAAGGTGSAAETQSKKSDALKSLQRRAGTGFQVRPAGMGTWQKTSKDNRHRKHKDYAAPRKPPKRRQG